jgi:hypothetical protein
MRLRVFLVVALAGYLTCVIAVLGVLVGLVPAGD